MSYKLNLKGKIYGYLQALEETNKKERGYIVWKCKCLRCGNIVYKSTANLLHDGGSSCGCIKHDMMKERGKENIEIFNKNKVINGINVISLNSDKPNKNNKSGVKGVSWSKEKKKWKAQIYYNGKNKFLGRFDTIEEAKAARKKSEEYIRENILNKKENDQ